MAGRSVWSDPEVLALTSQFVPASDEVWRLKRKQDAEGDFFRRFCDLGHYRGGDEGNNTRQGIYAVTAQGELLASSNTRDSKEVVGLLTEALNKFAKRNRENERDNKEESRPVHRLESKYPEDGLALRSFVRDLLREDAPNDWRRGAWNQDYAWFTKDEAIALATPGSSRAAILSRFARTHLLDSVRGQTEAFEPNDVTESLMHFEVVSEGDGLRKLGISGSFRLDRPGEPAFEDMPEEPARGVDAKMLGSAAFSLATERFTSFEVVVLGVRWGGTPFNGRHDDPGPSAIGWLFELAGNSPDQRVAPSHLWDAYNW